MRTQAATHAGAKVPSRSPRAIYREHFADARRERLFLSSVAFFLTFAIVRTITYAIHTGRGPLHDVVVVGMHLHHLVLGILLLLGVGYLWLAQVGTGIGRSLDWPSRLTALLHGGSASRPVPSKIENAPNGSNQTRRSIARPVAVSPSWIEPSPPSS